MRTRARPDERVPPLLREVRGRLGLTQKAMAERIGVGLRLYAKAEAGDVVQLPVTMMLAALAVGDGHLLPERMGGGEGRTDEAAG